MAAEQKSNGNAFEEDKIELKEVIRRHLQEQSVDPASEQVAAGTSRPINQDTAEDKDAQMDDKEQDDRSKGDRGESKSDKGQDYKPIVGEGRADKAKDDEGTGAKGKGGKGEKGKGKADHDKIQGDAAQDTTDATPPPIVEPAVTQDTKDTSKVDQEEGCGMKCLMFTIECCECVIS